MIQLGVVLDLISIKNHFLPVWDTTLRHNQHPPLFLFAAHSGEKTEDPRHLRGSQPARHARCLGCYRGSSHCCCGNQRGLWRRVNVVVCVARNTWCWHDPIQSLCTCWENLSNELNVVWNTFVKNMWGKTWLNQSHYTKHFDSHLSWNPHSADVSSLNKIITMREGMHRHAKTVQL